MLKQFRSNPVPERDQTKKGKVVKGEWRKIKEKAYEKLV